CGRSVQGRWRGRLGSETHRQDVEPACMAVDSVDDATFVHENIVELNRTRWCAFRRRGDKGRDLFRLIRIGNVVSAHTAVEESANHDLVRLPGGWGRWGFGSV